MKTKAGTALLTTLLCLVFIFTGGITYPKEEAGDMREGNLIDYGVNDLYMVKMSYRLEGAYSPYKYIQIEIDGTGEGKLSYELYREYVDKDQVKEGIVKFMVDEARLKELAELYQGVDFFNLELTDINKDKIRVTDVGTTTLTYTYQGKQRKLSYGYVENNPLQELIKLYWRLAREYLPR